MASTVRSGDSTAACAALDAAGREKADAAKLLDLVFGAEVLAAIHEGFLKDGDFRAVVPLLGAPATANAHVRAATQAVFEEACAAGEAGVAGLCLAHAGVDGNARVGGDGTVLGAAAGRGDSGMVRALAASGKVDVNQAATATGSSALTMASNRGHGVCVVALLAADGIDTNHANAEGSTALTLASQNGRAEIVRALLAVDEIDANHADDDGSTALFMASQEGHTEVVRALLAVGGIDANHADDAGNTALIMASQDGHAEVVRALLAVGGIDVNPINVDDSSALMLAVSYSHTSCARALVAAKGIDINLKSPQFGNGTALHDACGDLHGTTRTEMVGLLLTAGGCRFQLDDAGQTPLDMAAGDKGVLKVFASGIDYWQRRRHGGHGWAMKEAVTALLLVRQRLDGPAAPAAGSLLVHLPEEIWLEVCAFLRGADFMP